MKKLKIQKKLLIRARQIAEGEILPPFYYGLAYHNWASDHSYWYIIPLNYFIRWAKWLQGKWNRFRSRPSWIDNEILKAVKKREDHWAESLSNACRDATYYKTLYELIKTERNKK